MIFKKINDGYLDENGIIWRYEHSKNLFNFNESIEYCETIGYGWRLPTIKEMISVVNYGKSEPATNLPDMMPSSYWSASIYDNITDIAWLVNFIHGHVSFGNKDYKYHVRAVKDFNSKAVEKKDDMVNSPKHYQKVPRIECIDVVEHFNFNLGNVIKYAWRCDEKENHIEDLEKARWYLEREIEMRKKIDI